MPFAQIPLGRGLYTAADARAVPPGMAQAVNNVMLDRDPAGRAVGAMVRRGSATYATGASGIITGGVEYRTGVDTRQLLWSSGDKLREGTSGTVVYTSTHGSGAGWQFLPMRDPADGKHKLYCILGNDLFVWNGFTMKHLTGANVYQPKGYDQADPPEEPNVLADETDEIHLAGVIGTAWGALALAYKDRVYFSHPLLYDYFPVNSYWDVVSDKGDAITTIQGTQGTVLIGKDRSLFAIRGTDFENSILEPVTLQLGIPSGRTAVGAEELGGVVFQGSDSHIYLYQTGSSEPVCLSQEIEGTIRAINPDQIVFANAIVWDRKYWLRTPTGDSALPNLMLVYDFATRQWEYHDNLPAGFTAFVYERVPLFGTITGTLLRVDTGTTDNGTAITGEYRTGTVAPGGPSVKHLYQTLFLTASGSGTLTVRITVDGTVRTRSVALSSTMQEFRVPINAAGKWCDVRVSGSAWHLLGPATVEYQMLDVGRGRG